MKNCRLIFEIFYYVTLSLPYVVMCAPIILCTFVPQLNWKYVVTTFLLLHPFHESMEANSRPVSTFVPLAFRTVCHVCGQNQQHVSSSSPQTLVWYDRPTITKRRKPFLTFGTNTVRRQCGSSGTRFPHGTRRRQHIPFIAQKPSGSGLYSIAAGVIFSLPFPLEARRSMWYHFTRNTQTPSSMVGNRRICSQHIANNSPAPCPPILWFTPWPTPTVSFFICSYVRSHTRERSLTPPLKKILIKLWSFFI